MEEYVTLEMLVNKAVADEVTQKGLAEIALRRADAKFKAMVKCRILGDPTATELVPQRIASSAMRLSIPGENSMESVRGAMRSLEKGLGKKITSLTTTTKNMAVQVDGIYQLTRTVQSLSYLNVGLSMANLAVDVAGFVVVNDKLNMLSSEVQLAANKINKIANVQKNEKISDCQKLIMRFNALSSKIRRGDNINLDDLEHLIIDMRAYLSEMILNLHDDALGTELVLKIINSLLPAYTLLFSEFTKRYYYQHQCLPGNYEVFLKLYDELEDMNFRAKLHDHYFLDERLHSQDVLDRLNAQMLLGLNGRVQIEDQTAILQMLGTRERVEEFDRELDSFVESWVRDKTPVMAAASGASRDECLKFFDLDSRDDMEE